MKIIEILQKYAEGLLASGNILLILCGILLTILGFGLALIAYIFKIGFKLFVIFLDEALYFSILGLQFLEKSVQSLRTFLNLLYYFLMKFIENLDLNISIPEKPKISKNPLYFFLYIMKSLFYYVMSLIIVTISLYWLLTYVEVVNEIFSWSLSLLSMKWPVVDYINEFFKEINDFIFNLFYINIFDRLYMWVIRIFAFLLIFWYRYFRLKKEEPNLKITSIFTFKKDNYFWAKQSSAGKVKRLSSIILLSFLILLITASWIFANKDSNTSVIEFVKEYFSDEKDSEIANIIAQIRGQEYKYALELIKLETEKQNTSEELRKSLELAKAYIEAEEYTMAIDILSKID